MLETCSDFWGGGGEAVWSSFTSGDTIFLLPQFQELEVQLVVFPDHFGILRPVGLQESVNISAFLLCFPCW